MLSIYTIYYVFTIYLTSFSVCSVESIQFGILRAPNRQKDSLQHTSYNHINEVTSWLCYCCRPYFIYPHSTLPCHQAFFHSCSRPGWSQRREKNYCLRPCCSWQSESWHSVSRLKGRLMPHKLRANKETIFREASMNKTKYNYEAEYY